MGNVNVFSGKPKLGGGVYRAPKGTALPTDASTALIAAYTPLGGISTDGLVPTRDTSIEKVRDWNGDVVAALLTDESASFAFTLIEVLGRAVNEFAYGTANVTYTAPTASAGTKLAILDKGGKPAVQVLVFELVYGAKKVRIVVPEGDPNITGEGPFVGDNINTYEVEVEATKDASGTRVYRYIENDDKV